MQVRIISAIAVRADCAALSVMRSAAGEKLGANSQELSLWIKLPLRIESMNF
jgi:hypothetical protein